MSDAPQNLAAGTHSYEGLSRPLGIFAAWRLQAYGYTLAALYAALLLGFYKAGVWIVDSRGVPVYSDFICPWVAGVEALHGDIALLYDPVAFVKLQEALVGPRGYFFTNWPYPPTFFFVLIPFAMLRYV